MTKPENQGSPVWRWFVKDPATAGLVLATLFTSIFAGVRELGRPQDTHPPEVRASLTSGQVYAIAHQVAAETAAPLEIKIDGVDKRIDDLRSDLHANGSLSDARP